ncbi:MAG: endonuclease Q family protein, partial [Candidatus Micrarchaeota archaeon]
GFDSLKEAFEDKEDKIYAIETGLSSDPAMNWRCSWLDKKQLVSFSDAHSPEKLGREATVVDLKKMDYNELFDAIAHKEEGKLKKTIEFFPQEGKYYSDGCRQCEVRTTPAETKKYNGRCPKCKKNITKGVIGRVDELADRKEGEKPKGAPGYESIVPLRELVAMAIGTGVNTKSVGIIYYKLIEKFGNEFSVLLEADVGEIKKIEERAGKAIEAMREKKLKIEPGYDGKFGVVGLE